MHQLKPLIYLLIILLISCGTEKDQKDDLTRSQQLTIFFVNDQHGSLTNFAKIKHIVDAERAENPNTLLVSGGDLFSGNPIVDQYPEKGYPIIDIMNKTGFNASVLGNHEFDYGLSVLNDRLQQATFHWVCANVNTAESELIQPKPYISLPIGNLNVTILGLVETEGKPDDIIPSTHPWRVVDLTFKPFEEVIGDYKDLKKQEGSDVLLALTHLGSYSDDLIANDFPYFDLIVGGHTNNLKTEVVNGIPVLMAGANLSHLGKIELTIVDQKIKSNKASLIDLSEYPEYDHALKTEIDQYSETPDFETVVGYAGSNHNRTELGCFYTHALKTYMQVDLAFQNAGGIRADIDEGAITKMEIYNMDPFNNGSAVFTMSAAEIKSFFRQTGAGLHYSGISIVENNGEIELYNESGTEIRDEELLTVGINDYIPAVYDSYFSYEEADVRELTTAETIIQYLITVNDTLNQEGCERYFNFN